MYKYLYLNRSRKSRTFFSTAKAIVRHDRINRYRRRLFPGDVQDLGLELALGLRLAALRAGIRKDVRPRIFHRMKLRAFQEACMGEDVIANAVYGGRRPEGTLEEAGRVLGEETGLLGRFVGWFVG